MFSHFIYRGMSIASEDMEGLETHYDLIVLGTGLTESIISCAAGKAGVKVLHLDKNDYYGDKYNSNSLDGFLKFYSKANNDGKVIENSAQSTDVESVDYLRMFTPSSGEADDVFIAEFKSDPTVKIPNALSTRLDPSRLHPSCFGYQMEKEQTQQNSTEQSTPNTNSSQYNPTFHSYIKNKDITLSRALIKSREFNIDTTSKVLLSSGLFIDTLISSDVHKYLEFKAIEGLYYYINDNTASKVTTKDPRNDPRNELWRVPCSKNDIFSTNKLSLFDKRKLMNFYSFVLDYGKTNFSETDVYRLNEIELATGRSLYRPQNKEKSSADTAAGYNISKYLNLPFELFLKDCIKSPKLEYIIMYALCFRTTAPNTTATAESVAEGETKWDNMKHYTTREGVFDLYAHMNSLGE